MLLTSWDLEVSYMELHNMALLNNLHFVLCTEPSLAIYLSESYVIPSNVREIL